MPTRRRTAFAVIVCLSYLNKNTLRENTENKMMNHTQTRFHQSGKKFMSETASVLAIAFLLALSLLFVPGSQAQNSRGNNAFGFNSEDISGFPTGRAALTGGGAFNLLTGFVNSSGGFRCTSDVNQGPL